MPEPQWVEPPEPSRKQKLKRWLRKAVNSPIFAFIILITPQPVKFMLQWIKDRLPEKSTQEGLVALLAAIGVTVNPQLLEAIATAAVAIIAVIQIVHKEAKAQPDAQAKGK